MTTTTTTETDITRRELIRRLPDTDTQRNASVTVRPATIYCHGEAINGYDVISCHECWTGARWLQIVNKDEGFDFEHAVAIARAMRKGLEG